MIRRPPRSTRTDTLFPYTTLFRSAEARTRSLLRQELFALPRSVDPAPDDPGRAVARGRAVRNRDDDPAAPPVGARAGRASVRAARGVAGARHGPRLAAAAVPLPTGAARVLGHRGGGDRRPETGPARDRMHGE